jgi:hypothetical protein
MLFRSGLCSALLILAGCTHVEANGGTIIYTTSGWFVGFWVVLGLALMGTGAHYCVKDLKRIAECLRRQIGHVGHTWPSSLSDPYGTGKIGVGWGFLPAIMGVVILAFAIIYRPNERVAVDNEHFEVTSDSNTKSVRFDALRDITVKSSYTNEKHFHGIWTTTSTYHDLICHDKFGRAQTFTLTKVLLKAKPQIVTNAQKNGVTLIGFEQLRD